MEVTNKELLAYCKVFYDHFLPAYLKEGKFVRIDLFTKESNFVVVSVYPHDDKNCQGIVIHEGKGKSDDQYGQARVTKNSFYVVKKNLPEFWTVDEARKDLCKALLEMEEAIEGK